MLTGHPGPLTLTPHSDKISLKKTISNVQSNVAPQFPSIIVNHKSLTLCAINEDSDFRPQNVTMATIYVTCKHHGN